MGNWFTRLFGARSSKTPAAAASPAPPRPIPFPAPTATATPEPPAARRFNPLEAEFLEGFLTSAPARSLDELALDDRLFIAGIRNRWHKRQLDLPVLPQAAIELRELLRRGDVAIPRYVELLEQDSALTVEVLKAANSAQLGGATTVTNTADAVVRIGLQRLETILLLAQVKSKVLKGGPLQTLGEMLVTMALPMAVAASKLAASRQQDTNLAFTRATLLHVEHLVILGALPDVSREHKRTLAPSVAAVHQAFTAYGAEIRQAVARSWGLEDLLIGGDEAESLTAHFASLRNQLAAEWLENDRRAA